MFRIYELKCNTDPSLTYIGSTSCTINRRMNQHKAILVAGMDDPRRCLNVHKSIVENGGWDNWTCSVLHESSTGNQLEKEREFIVSRNPSLNKREPYKTREESLKLRRERCKKYWLENLEDMHAYQRQYYLDIVQGKKWTCEICELEMALSSKYRHNKRKHNNI